MNRKLKLNKKTIANLDANKISGGETEFTMFDETCFNDCTANRCENEPSGGASCTLPCQQSDSPTCHSFHRNECYTVNIDLFC